MAKIHFVAKRPAVQVHPRVLIVDHQCCDCAHGKEFNGATFNLNCTFHDRMVNKYDECSAFEKKVKEE